jgi:hypothetical protein
MVHSTKRERTLYLLDIDEYLRPSKYSRLNMNEKKPVFPLLSVVELPALTLTLPAPTSASLPAQKKLKVRTQYGAKYRRLNDDDEYSQPHQVMPSAPVPAQKKLKVRTQHGTKYRRLNDDDEYSQPHQVMPSAPVPAQKKLKVRTQHGTKYRRLNDDDEYSQPHQVMPSAPVPAQKKLKVRTQHGTKYRRLNDDDEYSQLHQVMPSAIAADELLTVALPVPAPVSPESPTFPPPFSFDDEEEDQEPPPTPHSLLLFPPSLSPPQQLRRSARIAAIAALPLLRTPVLPILRRSPRLALVPRISYVGMC